MGNTANHQNLQPITRINRTPPAQPSYSPGTASRWLTSWWVIAGLLLATTFSSCGNPRLIPLSVAMYRIEHGEYQVVNVRPRQFVLEPGQADGAQPDISQLPQGRAYADFKPEIHRAVNRAKQRGHHVELVFISNIDSDHSADGQPDDGQPENGQADDDDDNY